MHHNLIIKDGDATKVEKQILVDGIQFVDETPTPGSLNHVTSGGVAESVAQQSSNIAPEYAKKTYEANSYVIYGGVLYTNPNAIGTAEDWNPAHWTQTAVAEIVPEGTSQSNPLMNAVDVERMINAMKPIEAMTLRFEFSKKDYNPETAGVGSAGTWTKVDSPTLNIWDWTNEATDWSESFKGAFPDADNEVSVIAAGDTSDVVNISYMFAGELNNFAYKVNYSLTHRNNVVSCIPFDVSSCVNFEGVFEGSTLRNVVPFKYNPSLTYSTSGETHSVIFADTYIENVADLDFYGITSVSSGMFARCTKLKKVSLKGLYNFADINNTFWGNNTEYCIIEEFELIGGLNSSNLTLFFQNCRKLKKVSGLIDNNNIGKVGCQGIFNQCFALENVEFSVGKADRVDYLYHRCYALKELPYVDTSLCNIFTYFAGYTEIETIPDLDVSSATDVSYMFTNCRKVKHGILEMYNKLLSRGSAITDKENCFNNCGIDTEEGRAALSQIPQSWGGLAEG